MAHKPSPTASAFDSLTPQAKRYVQELMIDGVQYKAAIRAGYSPKAAREVSSRLMTNPKVKAAIEEKRKEVINETGITPERIIIELGKIAFADIMNYTFEDENGDTYVDFQKMAKDPARSAITELIVESTTGKVKTKRIRLKLADKINALEKLAKHFGMLKDKVEVTGKLTLEQLVERSFIKDDKTTADSDIDLDGLQSPDSDDN